MRCIATVLDMATHSSVSWGIASPRFDCGIEERCPSTQREGLARTLGIGAVPKTERKLFQLKQSPCARLQCCGAVRAAALFLFNQEIASPLVSARPTSTGYSTHGLSFYFLVIAMYVPGYW